MTPALFLDRDGVINVDTNFLYRAQDVLWIDGIFSLCSAALQLGHKLVVVTNQSGIGRGLYSQNDFDQLTEWMRAQFLARHVPLDAVYCCPFHPREGLGLYKREHEDRKPSPGMLLRAARDLHLDLAQSILVGDRCSDIAAANNAHLRQAFLLAGTESSPCPGPHLAVSSLAEVERWLQAHPPATHPPTTQPPTPQA
jgi:D-glycero-D-manno-heptose 1,7-bisphosphate phosphatase